MDAQLKRGFLEVCVLASIQEKDSYGYQILKDVPPKLGLTESTLYPILKRLEASHCLSVYTVEHNSRLRKYYSITPAGRKRIAEFIQEWDDIVAIFEYIQKGVQQ